MTGPTAAGRRSRVADVERRPATAEFDRASGIGGSDISAILGINPWRSPFDVWLEKVKDPSWRPTFRTARMRLGQLIEPALAAAYEEDHPGRRVIRNNPGRTYWHENKIAYAHLDGTLDDEGIWEGKSAGDDRDWHGGVPDYYEAQVRQYLAITGEPYCDVTVVFLNKAEFKHYRIEADPTDEGIIEVGRRFWYENVLPGRPPDVDGSEAAARYLANINPDRILEPAIRATPTINQLGIQLKIARQNEAAIAAARAELENKIKEAMGEHARMRGTGWSVLWKQSKPPVRVGWEEVAKAYRKLVETGRTLFDTSVDAATRKQALAIFSEADLDAILSLYTVTGEATHPFRFTVEDDETDAR